ncbi:hypothetical protein R3P38DRAFT_2796719 [Favolaschia claudopus]|uniref:Uncharacterized protein n=1 Tax=Favolaschia claudopus TaxID=2862362 RepID=A0AAW0A544_9AGAR
MPRDNGKTCPCGCGAADMSQRQIRRHLREQTTQSVRVAQQQNYAEQRRRLLRLEVQELGAVEPGNRGRGPASDEEDSRSDRMEEGFDNDAPAGTRSNTPMLNDEELESEMDSDSDDAGDPYGTRLDELFWEESDEGRRGPSLATTSGQHRGFRACPRLTVCEKFSISMRRSEKIRPQTHRRRYEGNSGSQLQGRHRLGCARIRSAVACFPGARRPSIATTPANADLLPLRSCPSEI